ncbi:MAG: DUF3833 domain-containing protein [Shewanella sp.]|nr:DUF3833 domain-containing protein [Shewanella sp.]MCF1429876.1 DUF3833 domain-containing protein [Shewanella sp.]MCF1438904.1 DUF3833 domain-containing protein [Shewanella sp.]MCF1457801.1 DUF3833 domain-containing protein [Shewanella sp.]
MRLLMALFLVLMMSGCGSVDIQDYRDTQPRLVLEEFFQGDLTASGVVQDFSGRVVRKFNVSMKASWRDNQLTLDEDFIYDDGEIQKRVWVIDSLGEGKYRGRAGDILGEAQGQAVGSALRWQYEMLLPVDGSEYAVSFDDWMFLVDGHTIINRSDINKFGITVAQVTLVIQKTQH